MVSNSNKRPHTLSNQLFKAKPSVPAAALAIGNYQWLKDQLDSKGYLTGYIINDKMITQPDESMLNPIAYWCDIIKESIKRIEE